MSKKVHHVACGPWKCGNHFTLSFSWSSGIILLNEFALRSQAWTLSLLSSRAEPAQLKLFGSSQVGTLWSDCMSVCLPACQPVYLSVCLSVCLSFCLPVFLFIFTSDFFLPFHQCCFNSNCVPKIKVSGNHVTTIPTFLDPCLMRDICLFLTSTHQSSALTSPV